MVQPTPPCSFCEEGLYSPVPLTVLSLNVRLFKKHSVTLRTKCCICEKNNQLLKKANLQLTGEKVCRLGGLSTVHLVLYPPPTLWCSIWAYILSTESIATHSSHKVSNSRNKTGSESVYIKIHTRIQT